MKRIVLGMLLGMLLAPASSVAEGEHEALALLCARFEAAGGDEFLKARREWAKRATANRADINEQIVMMRIVRDTICAR